MVDLKGALLAAAEEAGRIQDELNTQRTRIDTASNHIECLEKENNTLKTKFRQAGKLMRQLATLFDSEEVL